MYVLHGKFRSQEPFPQITAGERSSPRSPLPALCVGWPVLLWSPLALAVNSLYSAVVTCLCVVLESVLLPFLLPLASLVPDAVCGCRRSNNSARMPLDWGPWSWHQESPVGSRIVNQPHAWDPKQSWAWDENAPCLLTPFSCLRWNFCVKEF